MKMSVLSLPVNVMPWQWISVCVTLCILLITFTVQYIKIILHVSISHLLFSQIKGAVAVNKVLYVSPHSLRQLFSRVSSPVVLQGVEEMSIVFKTPRGARVRAWGWREDRVSPCWSLVEGFEKLQLTWCWFRVHVHGRPSGACVLDKTVSARSDGCSVPAGDRQPEPDWDTRSSNLWFLCFSEKLMVRLNKNGGPKNPEKVDRLCALFTVTNTYTMQTACSWFILVKFTCKYIKQKANG